MNSKGIVAIEDHGICMKCLNKKATHTYVLPMRGYGSSFDGTSTKLQLCDDCHSDDYVSWFNEIGEYEDDDCYCETYKHEDDIFDLIETLPLESQELFFNTFETGWNTYKMDAQDWIDYELNELPHEKCKEYNLYSPQEITAYHDRFPTCNHVFLKTWADGSGGCKCKFGAYGNKDGTCDSNISSSCYQCTNYTPRVEKMLEISEIDEFIKAETKRLEDMLEYASSRMDVLKQGYDKYIEKYGE